MMQKTEIQFTYCEINSWGGVSVLKKMLYQSDFVRHLEELPLPEHKAFERYFCKFGIWENNQISGKLYQRFFSSLKFDNFTLDIDSSVITRYGEQEGSAKGYNRHKPGRKSQYALLAFVADVEMVANFWNTLALQIVFENVENSYLLILN
jgi:hypothetical protein